MTEQTEPQPENRTGTSDAFVAPAAAPGSTSEPNVAPTGAVPWGTPPPTPTTESTAVVAVVCSVLSWIALPVILAIVALVLAASADREIAASGGAKSGSGLVTAARWIAWINLLVSAMVVAFVAAFIVAVAIAR